MLVATVWAVVNQHKVSPEIILVVNTSGKPLDMEVSIALYSLGVQVINTDGPACAFDGRRIGAENALGWLWLLDDDCVPSPLCLHHMLKRARSKTLPEGSMVQGTKLDVVRRDTAWGGKDLNVAREIVRSKREIALPFGDTCCLLTLPKLWLEAARYLDQEEKQYETPPWRSTEWACEDFIQTSIIVSNHGLCYALSEATVAHLTFGSNKSTWDVDETDNQLFKFWKQHLTPEHYRHCMSVVETRK
jgi:hypothetical protein